MHTASYFGFLEIIKSLVDAGAKLNEPNAYGSTPFHTLAQGLGDDYKTINES